MTIKIAISWAECLTKEKQEIHCVISSYRIGVYAVIKASEIKDKNKVVYSGG